MPYETDVFINCPYDSDYDEIIKVILFGAVWFGLSPRMASEAQNAGEARISKILRIVNECKFGIHDLSRMRATKKGEIARFNMPFELGLDYGVRNLDTARFGDKVILILDKEKYDYQKAISDLSNSDIKYHNNAPSDCLKAVREWLISALKLHRQIGPTEIWYRYQDFQSFLYQELEAHGYTDHEKAKVPFSELLPYIREWVDANR